MGKLFSNVAESRKLKASFKFEVVSKVKIVSKVVRDDWRCFIFFNEVFLLLFSLDRSKSALLLLLFLLVKEERIAAPVGDYRLQ